MTLPTLSAPHQPTQASGAGYEAATVGLGAAPGQQPTAGYNPAGNPQLSMPPYPGTGYVPGQDPAAQQYHEFETMPITAPQRKPRKPTPPRDPLAVAIGNGSLLGVGYGLLGKRWLAVLAVLVAGGLVAVLATVARELWLELVVVALWVGVIWHGWHLARKQPRPTVPGAARKQRFVALAFALPVLLVFGFLRFDAWQIEQDVTDARAAGNCEQALAATDSRWFGHRIANAPMTRRTDDTVRACDLLRQANGKLDTGLTGDAAAVEAGLGQLRTVLADVPGHDQMVDRTLNRFLDQLPTDDPCDTAAIADELRETRKSGTLLDRANEIVPEIAPTAIVDCGDDLMAAGNWERAKESYEQLLDQYPDHDLAPRATEGVTKATQAIELAKVRQLLAPPYSSGNLPNYCTSPAPYSAAPPYGAARPNRALIYGTEYSSRLPVEWGTNDPATAVLVICAAAAQFGAAQETCAYESLSAPGVVSNVTFHRIVIPVRVFELKTGRVVADATVEIGGASCPQFINGMENARYVEPSDGDVHAGFNALINP